MFGKGTTFSRAVIEHNEIAAFSRWGPPSLQPRTYGRNTPGANNSNG
jgi:hypothetical protein